MTDAHQDILATLAPQFIDVADEIVRARSKHGDQKHLPLINRFAEEYADEEERFKRRCDNALARDNSSWDFILLEEVYEALAALQAGDLVAARPELVQVIAMASAMLEIVDSNMLES